MDFDFGGRLGLLLTVFGSGSQTTKEYGLVCAGDNASVTVRNVRNSKVTMMLNCDPPSC